MSILGDCVLRTRAPAHIEVVQLLRAAEFHWHFVQGIQAVNARLYVPGCLSLLAGIETSIRSTLFQLQEPDAMPEDLGQTMSNSLLRTAQRAGLPVDLLAFPSEPAFLESLRTNRPHVEIVAVRHDLLHGNILRFSQSLEGAMIFSPECLRPTSLLLRRMAVAWARALSEFRAQRLGL